MRHAWRTEHHRNKVQYVYPPSPTSNSLSRPPSPGQGTSSLPLSQRLRLLQAEVAALEVELSDPTNPLLRKEKERAERERELKERGRQARERTLDAARPKKKTDCIIM